MLFQDPIEEQKNRILMSVALYRENFKIPALRERHWKEITEALNDLGNLIDAKLSTID